MRLRVRARPPREWLSSATAYADHLVTPDVPAASFDGRFCDSDYDKALPYRRLSWGRKKARRWSDVLRPQWWVVLEVVGVVQEERLRRSPEGVFVRCSTGVYPVTRHREGARG